MAQSTNLGQHALYGVEQGFNKLVVELTASLIQVCTTPGIGGRYTHRRRRTPTFAELVQIGSFLAKVNDELCKVLWQRTIIHIMHGAKERPPYFVIDTNVVVKFSADLGDKRQVLKLVQLLLVRH